MPRSFQQIALITGGAQGIGKGIARHFLLQGMAVVIADCDIEAGEACLSELESLGRLDFIVTDVCQESSVQDCLKTIHERYGRLNALINNAGISRAHTAPIEELSLDAWQRVMQTNLTGSFLMAKYAIPLLRASCGAIINVASTRALQSEPHSEAYAATKGGLVSLTHALAISLHGEVRVNCISPGWIEVRDWQKPSRRQPPDLTPEDHAQHPAGRVGRPEDVAELAFFLISPGAEFISGQNIICDGGMTRKMIYQEPSPPDTSQNHE